MTQERMAQHYTERGVVISDDGLEGDLSIPPSSKAIVLFAHGNGSSRHSTRNRYVAQFLNDAGFATLLVDLLTPQEKSVDEKTRHLRFEIDLLARRFVTATEWITNDPETSGLKIGYFGSSTGAAAALIAAAELGKMVGAVVSRGGRPDLADFGKLPERVSAPTLLIVGANDASVLELNRAALKRLSGTEKALAVIPGAGHLFEEQGKMEIVADIAAEWFGYHLLENGRKFYNNYEQKASAFSMLKEKSNFHLRFKDRTSAGDMLSSVLSKYKNPDRSGLVVLGIPRGGMPVADRIARKLVTELDIVVPVRLRAPDDPESTIGAIMQDGSMYLDSNAASTMKISNEYLELEKSWQEREVRRRLDLYRRKFEYNIKDKTIILVDDGACTGATVIAAARWIRKQGPRKLIIALPVASKAVMKLLNGEVDAVEVLRSPRNFKAVGQFYQDFNDITDDQVIEIMKHNTPT